MAELKPYTGAWICPMCGESVPLTLYGRMAGGELTFSDVESPAPVSDVHAHVWSEHPEVSA